MANSVNASNSDFSEVDDAGISKEHWKSMNGMNPEGCGL